MNLINLDCLGYAGAEPFSFAFLTESNAFAKALWPYLQHVGYPPYWTDSTISSDHLSFSERGILSITLLEYPDSGAYCHMPEDTPDRLCAERIAPLQPGSLPSFCIRMHRLIWPFRSRDPLRFMPKHGMMLHIASETRIFYGSSARGYGGSF